MFDLMVFPTTHVEFQINILETLMMFDFCLVEFILFKIEKNNYDYMSSSENEKWSYVCVL